jgi:hypothetical protein
MALSVSRTCVFEMHEVNKKLKIAQEVKPKPGQKTNINTLIIDQKEKTTVRECDG